MGVRPIPASMLDVWEKCDRCTHRGPTPPTSRATHPLHPPLPAPQTPRPPRLVSPPSALVSPSYSASPPSPLSGRWRSGRGRSYGRTVPSIGYAPDAPLYSATKQSRRGSETHLISEAVQAAIRDVTSRTRIPALHLLTSEISISGKERSWDGLTHIPHRRA